MLVKTPTRAKNRYGDWKNLFLYSYNKQVAIFILILVGENINKGERIIIVSQEDPAIQPGRPEHLRMEYQILNS